MLQTVNDLVHGIFKQMLKLINRSLRLNSYELRGGWPPLWDFL